MRKLTTFATMLISILCALTGCKEQEKEQEKKQELEYADLLRYNRKVYSPTKRMAIQIDGDFLGKITSSVAIGTMPEKDFQCNNPDFVNNELYEHGESIYILLENGEINGYSVDKLYYCWEEGAPIKEEPPADTAPYAVIYNDEVYSFSKFEEYLDSFPENEGFQKMDRIIYYQYNSFPYENYAATTIDGMLGVDIYASEKNKGIIYAGPLKYHIDKKAKGKYVKMELDEELTYYGKLDL